VSGPRGANQSDPLKAILEEYMAVPGMKAAILVSDQGLTISSATQPDIDVESIAALVVDTASTAQRFGLQVEGGFIDTMSIEFEKMSVVLVPFAPDIMLALIAAPGCLGSARGASVVRSGLEQR
jgi:predicted regulator of Ras-like GTPase activity (Roadblock/LC7/MglB family)